MAENQYDRIKLLSYISVVAAAFGIVIYFFKQPSAALFDLLNDGRAVSAGGHSIYFLHGSIHASFETVIKDILLSLISIKIYDLASFDGLLIFKGFISAFFIVFILRWVNKAIGPHKRILLCGLFFFMVCPVFMDMNHLSAGAILVVILKHYSYVENPNEKKAVFYYSYIFLSYLLALTDARFFIVGLFIFIVGSFPLSRLFKGVSLWPVLTLLASIIVSCINPFGYKLMLYPFMSIRAWFSDDAITSFIPSKILSLQGIFIISAVVMIGSLLRYNDADKSLFSKVMLTLFGSLLLLVSKDLLWLGVILSFPLIIDYFYILEGLFPERSFKSVQKGNKEAKCKGKFSCRIKELDVLSNVFLCLLPAFIYLLILSFRFSTYYYNDSAYFPIDGMEAIYSERSSPQVLTDDKTGSFVNFFGCKTYFDDRYELYTRPFSKSYDVFSEYVSFETDPSFDIDGFVDKYGFDYIVLSSDSRPFMYLKGSASYTEVYSGNGYSVFKLEGLKGQ